MTTFQFSESRISQIQKIYHLLQWLIPVFLMVFMLFEPTVRKDPVVGIIITVMAVVFFEVMIFFMRPLVIKQLRQTKFTLTPEYVERILGRSVERINFDEIKSLNILENPSENLMVVIINSKKRSMAAFGVDGIEILADTLERGVADKSTVRRRNTRLISYDPRNLMLWGLAAGAAIILIRNLGHTAFSIFEILVFIVYGLYSLIFKPLTKSLGPDYEILEVFFGIFSLLFSLALIFVLVLNIW